MELFQLGWLMRVQVSSIKIDPYLNIDVSLVPSHPAEGSDEV